MEITLKDVSIPRTTDEGYLCGKPTGEVAQLLRRLRQQARKKVIDEPDVKFPLHDLTADEMQVLHDFASQVAGKTDCKVRSIDGCHSCFMGSFGAGRGTRCDRWGNLVQTDCGVQCWLCSIDCENGP